LLQRLRARESDFFIAEISTIHREPDLVAEPMSEHALYFVGQRDHPLALSTARWHALAVWCRRRLP
jgi:DNA-binding transcriptional LysR family regulator